MARCERGVLPIADPAIHDVGGDDKGQRGPKQLELLQHFGLQPSSAVLEIGCGLGRLAYELASFLDDDGTYAGFDIVPEAIEWLEENYAPHLPGFRFDLLDVQSTRYRKDGGLDASAVRFPYPDSGFDVVCAYEVFMHLPLEGVRNYLTEVSRVLRPGGVAVLSFMAIWENEDVPPLHGRPWVSIGDGVYTRFPKQQGLSMGYEIGLLRDLFQQTGLTVATEIEGRLHGVWKPRPPGPRHMCDLFAVHRAGGPELQE